MSFEETLEKINKRLDALEQEKPKGPNYALSPLALAAAMMKTCDPNESVKACAERLKEKVEAFQALGKELQEINKTFEAVPKTEEACKNAGGKWEDGKCVMPRETTEGFRGIGVLPTSIRVDRDKAKANALIKKIKGE